VLWVHSLAALWVLLGFAFMMIDDTLFSEQSEQDHVQMKLIRCFLDDLELQSQQLLSVLRIDVATSELDKLCCVLLVMVSVSGVRLAMKHILFTTKRVHRHHLIRGYLNTPTKHRYRPTHV
jgi:hypothetical protein